MSLSDSKDENKAAKTDCIEAIGGLGYWQIGIYTWVVINVFFAAMDDMAIIFLEFSPDHICVEPNSNVTYTAGANYR